MADAETQKEIRKGVVVPIKGLGFKKIVDDNCELCQLKRTTEWYDDSNPYFGERKFAAIRCRSAVTMSSQLSSNAINVTTLWQSC